MIAYIYNDTGEIEETVVAGGMEMLMANLRGRSNYVITDEDVDVRSDFVKNGLISPRPQFDIKKQGRLLSSIPKGTMLKIADQEFTIDDGTAELSDNVTEITLSLWPYIDEVITFED